MTRSRESIRAVGMLIAAGSALTVVMCASSQPPSPSVARPQPAPTPSAEQAPAPQEPAVKDASGAPAASAAHPGAPGQESVTELSRFYRALWQLERKERHDPVRILWLGDSHTAADFFPNALREPLQERFGVGGPGFVFVGLDAYRHDAVRFEQDGRWRRRPRSPSFWKLQDDGIFGLGGMRTIPLSGASQASIELKKGAVVGRARWEIVYRTRKGDSFRVSVDGESAQEVTSGTAEANAFGLARITLETGPTARVTIDHARGEPEIFGAVIESTEPGVVVDTLGINGARVGTPVAWNEDAWVSEVERRSPQLAVIAYGTNEVGDMVAPFRYETEYVALVGRLRRAAPEVDCVIVGPTDRVNPDWTTNPRVREIEAVQKRAAAQLGCAFTSAVDLMGGENSLKEWADASPPLASNDRVHLTPKGYEKLGGDIAAELLDGYPPAQ